jgi:hypothetical protein
MRPIRSVKPGADVQCSRQPAASKLSSRGTGQVPGDFGTTPAKPGLPIRAHSLTSIEGMAGESIRSQRHALDEDQVHPKRSSIKWRRAEPRSGLGDR